MKPFRVVLSIELLVAAWTFGASVALATIFVPIPFEDQVGVSSAVIHAKYITSLSRKLADGEVVTEHTFKLLGYAGLEPREVINPNNFKVLVPGGDFMGVTHVVHGTPQFKSGEESLLLLKKGGFGFAMYNLGMGKYKILRTSSAQKIKLFSEDQDSTLEEDGVYFVSEIFSDHPELGHIDKYKLNSTLTKRFGQKLMQVSKGHGFVSTPNNEVNLVRRPASGEGEHETFLSQSEYNINYFFLMSFLSLLGVIVARANRKSR